MEFKNLYEQLDRMVELINYSDSFIEEEYDVIYEGLIRTVSLNKAKVLIQRLFSTYMLYWRDNIETDETNNTLLVDIINFENDKDKIDYFIKYVNNLGYFISIIYVMKKGETKLKKGIKYDENILRTNLNNYKNIEKLIVVLESKFDIEEDNIPDKLYHVTRQDVIHKIKRIGLVPRSESKKSTHPERIYLGKKYSDVYDMAYHFKKENPNYNYVILEVDAGKIKHLRLFYDPNYRDYGYYVLVNIPPDAIKILKENI